MVKLSQFFNKLDIFPPRFMHYFDAFVATGIYVLFRYSFRKIRNINVYGGVKGLKLRQNKKILSVEEWRPSSDDIRFADIATQQQCCYSTSLAFTPLIASFKVKITGEETWQNHCDPGMLPKQPPLRWSWIKTIVVHQYFEASLTRK